MLQLDLLLQKAKAVTGERITGLDDEAVQYCQQEISAYHAAYNAYLVMQQALIAGGYIEAFHREDLEKTDYYTKQPTIEKNAEVQRHNKYLSFMTNKQIGEELKKIKTQCGKTMWWYLRCRYGLDNVIDSKIESESWKVGEPREWEQKQYNHILPKMTLQQYIRYIQDTYMRHCGADFQQAAMNGALKLIKDYGNKVRVSKNKVSLYGIIQLDQPENSYHYDDNYKRVDEVSTHRHVNSSGVYNHRLRFRALLMLLWYAETGECFVPDKTVLGEAMDSHENLCMMVDGMTHVNFQDVVGFEYLSNMKLTITFRSDDAAMTFFTNFLRECTEK